jgi:hypothetical protein
VTVWHHPNAPYHGLPVAYFACEYQAWSCRMLGVILDTDDAEVHREHPKRLVERWVSKHCRVKQPRMAGLNDPKSAQARMGTALSVNPRRPTHIIVVHLCAGPSQVCLPYGEEENALT